MIKTGSLHQLGVAFAAVFASGMLVLLGGMGIVKGIGATAPLQAKYFRYELARSVSPYELWHSTNSVVVTDADGRSIIYFPFDPENAEVEGKWRAQGIVLGGIGDLRSVPIAIRIWSTQSSAPDVIESNRLSRKNGYPTLLLSIAGIGCISKSNCAGKVLITVSSRGNFFVDSKFVGIAKAP